MKPVPMIGRTFGRLTVVSAAIPRRQPNGNSVLQWNCVCTCGRETVARGTALRHGNTTSCGCYHLERLREVPRREVVTYEGAHDRVRALNGSASTHPCIDCGLPASDWSYDGRDPQELRGGRGRCRYSLNPAHYDPRCRACHLRFDQPQFFLDTNDQETQSTPQEGAQV